MISPRTPLLMMALLACVDKEDDTGGDATHGTHHATTSATTSTATSTATTSTTTSTTLTGGNAHDSDGDGLTDDLEAVFGSDPQSADSDGDGLSDAEELVAGTDPNNSDTDGDGLSDTEEVETHGTDPTSADVDEDGLSDADELAAGTDPWNADTDGDGHTDGDELEEGEDPLVADTDRDGLTNEEEAKLGTDPANADSDGDDIDDKEEVETGTDPLDEDSDDDGLTDGDEVIRIGTDPLNADTDGDGYSDGEEVEGDHDPFDPEDPATNPYTTFEGSQTYVYGFAEDPTDYNYCDMAWTISGAPVDPLPGNCYDCPFAFEITPTTVRSEHDGSCDTYWLDYYTSFTSISYAYTDDYYGYGPTWLFGIYGGYYYWGSAELTERPGSAEFTFEWGAYYQYPYASYYYTNFEQGSALLE